MVCAYEVVFVYEVSIWCVYGVYMVCVYEVNTLSFLTLLIQYCLTLSRRVPQCYVENYLNMRVMNTIVFMSISKKNMGKTTLQNF